MIKGLTEVEKYKVIRPIIGDCEYDKYGFPVIRRLARNLDYENLEVRNFKCMKSLPDNDNKLLMMFSYDKDLLRFWNDPLKRIPMMQTYAAVATPDFSIYPTMNINDIRHNVYMGRWLGRTWQNYGLSVIPTVGWALPDTYDMCFSAIESKTPVIISTLGCTDYQDDFLRGFNEMKARIEPPIVIVFGNMIPGMTGTFLNFKYTESFAVKNKQLRIEGIPSIFTIKEAV